MPFIVADMEEDPRSLIAADIHGMIVGVSRAFTQQSGWPKAELIGKPLNIIIPTALRDAHNLGFSRFITTGAPTLLETPLDLEVLKADGQTTKAQHYIWTEKGEPDRIFVAEIKFV